MDAYFIPEPGKPKWVRCTASDDAGVCNHVIRENSTRQKEHLTWTSPKNNVAKCKHISEHERNNLLNPAAVQFIKTPAGFRMFKPNKAKRHLAHYVHDEALENVMCRWCGLTLAYTGDARMRAHYLQDQPSVQFCLKIPQACIDEIMASKTSTHTLMEMALREHISRLQQTGRDDEAWYSDPATTRLLTAIGRLPRMPGYRPLPYQDLVKRAREE